MCTSTIFDEDAVFLFYWLRRIDDHTVVQVQVLTDTNLYIQKMDEDFVNKSHSLKFVPQDSKIIYLGVNTKSRPK